MDILLIVIVIALAFLLIKQKNETKKTSNRKENEPEVTS